MLPKSRTERDHLWAIREDLGPIRHDRPLFTYDVSLPLTRMNAYVDEVAARVRARWPGGRFHVLGHVGDGNLHFVVCPGVEDPGLHEQVDAAVYEPLACFGGAVSAEHGIGTEKREWLHSSRNRGEIGLMRRLKRSLDTNNILNPVIPH